MKYCTQCGSEIFTEDAKYCSNCGLLLSANEIPTTQPNQTSLNQKNKRINKVIFTVVIISILIIISILSSLIIIKPFETKSEQALENSVALLGTSCDNILNNDEYTFSSSMGIIIARKTTNSIFGVEGENVIFILPDDEYVTIVTWESSDETVLTEEQIETFITGMEKTYGECIDNSDDNSYIWKTKTCIINLQIDEKENSLTILFGSN